MNAQVALALDLTGAIASAAFSFQTTETQRSFEVSYDPSCRAVWQTRSTMAKPSVSLPQLQETQCVDEKITTGGFCDVQFKVIASNQPGVFSLGGDLEFFCHCIESQDRVALYEYALLAAKAIWSNTSGFGSKNVKPIAVVQGEAQGGGFEAALSCCTLIAEHGACFGFPESLFGMFPGMGGAVLLETKVDTEVANRIVEGAGRYSAEFLTEIGVVDYLVPRGEGTGFAEAIMHEVMQSPNCANAQRMAARQDHLASIRFDSLLASIDRWTDQAVKLSARNQRSMKYIVEMQNRRAA